MTDVQLFQGPDGGDVEVTNGVLTLDETPFTAVYLSLFGGNVEDDGTTAKRPKEWWANAAERVAERRYRSQTQAMLIGLPAIPANAKRVEEAISADLAWMLADIAKSIAPTVTIPARNTAKLHIEITGKDDVVRMFDFTRPWSGSKA